MKLFNNWKRANRLKKLRRLGRIRDRTLKETNYGVASNNLFDLGACSVSKEWGGMRHATLDVKCDDGWSHTFYGDIIGGAEGLLPAIKRAAHILMLRACRKEKENEIHN